MLKQKFFIHININPINEFRKNQFVLPLHNNIKIARI